MAHWRIRTISRAKSNGALTSRQGTQGVSPTAEQEKEFVASCLLPNHINGLKQRAESLVTDFLEAALEKKLNELALEVAQSELYEKFSAVQTTVNSDVGRIEKKLDDSVARIEKKLDEKKGWRGWGRDVATAFISGLMVILAIGILFNGYARLASINTQVEKASGIDLEAQQKKQETSDRESHKGVSSASAKATAKASD